MQYQGSKKVLNRVPFRRFWDFTVAAWNKSCQTILDVLCKVKSGAEGGTRTLTPFQVPHFECGASTIPPLPLVLHFKVEGYLLIVFNELNQERFELWNKPKHAFICL